MTAALLIELLVKSGVIAGAGLLLAAALRERPATEGVDVLRVTVLLLLALPVLMLLTPDLVLPWLPAVAASETASAASLPLWAGDVGPVAGVSLSTSLVTPTPGLLIAWAWAAGAAFVAGRFALGLWTLAKWTRSGRPVKSPLWTAPLERVSAHRRPRLLASSSVSAPLSWGLPPGVVLIGDEHVARPECARAVLAHELAHICRRDWLFLLLSRCALALFWFNPLVWWLHAELAARTEDAADAEALKVLDPGAYARTLVGLAADFGQPAALGMTGPARSLSKRIARIMKTRHALPARPLTLALTVGALIAVATPLAAVELAPRAPLQPQAPAAPLAPEAPPAPPSPPEAMHWIAPPAPPAPPAAPEAPQAPEAPRWSGQGRVVTYSELTPAQQREVDEALREASAAREAAAQVRVEAQQARAEAAQARAEAAQARAEANAARIQARAFPRPAVAPMDPAARAEVRARADSARQAARVAQGQAAEARRDAARHMARARVDMARGADDMERGARQMREESRRLLDPAYRAEVIERQRQQGHPTTDAELQALSPRLARQADDMTAQAARLRNRSTEG